MRLDKCLGHMGIGSRTQIKQLLKQGRVRVNAQIVKKADLKIDTQHDQITVDDQVITYTQYHYFMLNKPQGVVSATKDMFTKTVVDLIHEPVKALFPVGRLDKDTTGLLLLTNDGQLAHALLSPKKHVPKVYIAQVKHQLHAENIDAFQQGITLDDGYTCLPAQLEILADTTAKITIQEGKFHQIKRMFHACDNQVVTLKRIQMGPLQLDETLAQGAYRALSGEEITALKNATQK